MLDWYTQKIPYLLHEFQTDLERGLSHQEATAHQRQYGSNDIQPARKTSLFIVFLKQFTNLTAIILFGVSGLLLYLQRPNEALAVFSVFCLHVFWLFIQKAKTRHQLHSIQRHLEISVGVIRDGEFITLPPTAIVPGDLLRLTEGDYIAADARLVDADGLLVDETSLFGTPTTAQKTDADISTAGLPPEKQSNMVFAGTYVIEGEARAIVVATGEQLEINNPSRRVPATLVLDAEAEVQVGIIHDYFRIAGGILGGLAAIAAWLLGGEGFYDNWSELLFVGLGFVIASIPEGVVSTSRAILAQNAYKLLRKGVALRDLISVERLSGVTAICVDEIGNFMREEMSPSHVFVDERLVDRETWEAWLKSLEEKPPDELGEYTIPTTLPDSQVPPGFPLLVLLASRCTTHSRGTSLMNQTSALAEDSIDAALNQIAGRIGFDLDRYDATFSKVDELPQTFEHPYKTLVLAVGERKFLQLTFGDAEAVLKNCYRIQLHGTIDYLDYDHKELASQAVQYLTDSRTQVFGLAYRHHNAPPPSAEMRRNMTFLGLIAFTQLEYPNSKAAVQSCLDAGVKIIMITDKNRNMASDIAREFGIIQDKNAVVTKEDLEGLNEAQYELIVDRLLVYCRPSPKQKLNIVQYLKRHGHSMGFAGTSPRDLQTMQIADVSFASAARTSDIIQQNAACLVIKDGFHVLRDLLLHVRASYINLRSSMRWMLACSLGQIFTLMIGFVLPYFGWMFPILRELPMPLSLLQIIWIHLLVNLMPLMSLGHERIRGDLRYMRPQKIPPFFSKRDFSDILVRSIVIGTMGIFSFVLTFLNALEGLNPITEAAKQHAQIAAQTAACTTLIFTQLATSFQCHRHFGEPLFRRIGANRPLLITILACMALHLCVVYLPATQQLLGFTPLMKAWRWILAFCGMLIFLPLNIAHQR